MRLPLVLIAALALSVAATPAAWGRDGRASTAADARQRLNVVLILADDERLDGDTVMTNVRRLLADHGVSFSNYHVSTSECGPSRASILTGQYAHHTGVLDNFGLHSYPAFRESSTLPVWLHDAGYRTALVGKYLNDYTLFGDHRIPPGWDDWQVIDSVPEESYYDYTLNENSRLVHYGHRPADYSTTVLTRKATAFLRSVRRPFFLYFAPVTPHLPAIPAPQDRGRLENLAPLHSPAFNERDLRDKPWRDWHRKLLNAAAALYENHVRERQLESLRALDRSVAAIVATLRQRKLLGRTVIVYTSDNGFLYGEHRLGGKLWPYEDSTHVPLVVRAPWTAAASVDRSPVLNIDLASTIAALAGVTPQLPQDGHSFLPLLEGVWTPWRNAYLLEYLGRDALRTGGPPPYQAIHTRRYLYVEYTNGWRELYDLARDPWELRNVAGSSDYLGIELTLHERLARLETALPSQR